MNKDELVKVYLEKTKAVDELAKQAYLNNLFAFNQDILKVEEGGDGQNGKRVPLKEFHRELCQFVERNPTRKKLILMPRGHLKTTVITIGYSLQRIAKDPKVRILLANATGTMAEAFLSQIKKHLQYNDTFRQYFGDLTTNASTWRDNMITLPTGEGSYQSKEATVTAYGLGGSLVSQHYDVIIVDDPHNRENINTKDQIEKVKQSYRDLLDLLEPQGTLIVIGTRWHDDDLYGLLMDKNNIQAREFDTFIRHAITDMRLGREDGGHYKIESGNVLWPEKYSLKALSALLNEKGIYEFQCQYQNSVTDDENAVFHKQWFHEYDPTDLRDRKLTRFTAIDPAISLKERADFTAIVTIGVDVLGKIYVLEVKRGHYTEDQMVDELFLTNEKYHPMSICIETVAFQKTLQHYIMKEIKRQGHSLPLNEVLPESSESKEKRIRLLQPMYMRSDIYHSKSVANIEYLEDELLRFPKGKNDDVADCMAYAVRASFPPRQKEKEENSRGFLY
jgi:predicted phage terminase large subunit-like protein